MINMAITSTLSTVRRYGDSLTDLFVDGVPQTPDEAIWLSHIRRQRGAQAGLAEQLVQVELKREAHPLLGRRIASGVQLTSCSIQMAVSSRRRVRPTQCNYCAACCAGQGCGGADAL